MSGLGGLSVSGADAEAVNLARKLRFKYLLDRILAWVLLILLSPVFLLVAILIKGDGLLHPESAGSVFYREPRITAGKIFYILKFRTVSEKTVQWVREKPEARSITAASPQTAAGRFILSHYLDELPQLVNIAFSEMTFVGLRPHIIEQTQGEVEQGFRYRLQMRAGLFGVPQACKQEPKFQAILERMAQRHKPDLNILYKLDGLYVRKCQDFPPWRIFLFDLYLTGKCAQVILRGERSPESDPA